MHPVLRRKNRVVFVLALAALLFVVGEWLARRTPAGAWSSYRFIPHAPSDVMHFTNGVVRWFTCGVTEEGTYRRTEDGTWVWDYFRTPDGAMIWGQPTRPIPSRTNTFLLRPHLLWLTVIDARQPTNLVRLPRALRVGTMEHLDE